MPMTPNFNIDYPCLGVPVTLADFAVFATETEAALAVVDAEAVAVTHNPYARLIGFTAAAVGVETILDYTAFAATQLSSGVTVNNAAGTVTIITPGLYLAGLQISGDQSTLTMTSHRVALFVNGVLYATRKYQGTYPVVGIAAQSGVYDTAVRLAAGDVLTMRYLWTGTGALTSSASGSLFLDLLSSP